MTNVTKISHKIFNFFHKEAIILAKKVGFTKRRSKLAPQSFVKALIATCLSQQFSLEIFCSFLKEHGIQITKQGLHERFREPGQRLLQELSSLSLQHFKSEKLPHTQYLDKFDAINIIDSSTVSLHKNLSSLYKGSGGAASSSAMKIQLMFDYLQGQIGALTLTSGCDNDQGFDRYFQEIQERALYLMDLGYFKLNTFQKINNGNAYFVSRLLTGTKLFSPEGKSIELVRLLENSSALVSYPVLMGATKKIPVRLVAQRLPQSIADQRRRNLIENHRRRGSKPCAESLALQSWSIYITNTSEQQISNQEIHKTYMLRWQIELFFKLSKSLLKIHQINTKKSARVAIETYGKFITIMALLLMCEPIKHQEKYEVSLYKACKLFTTKLNEFSKALTSKYLCKKFIISIHESLLLFAKKDKKKTKALSLEGECF